jgi:hypothetical protein
MKQILNKLQTAVLHIMGGVPKWQHDATSQELKSVRNELEDCKIFIESIYSYAGNYPAWKAQQEYREILSSTHLELSVNTNKHQLHKHEYVDRYLGRIVDSFKKLIEKRPQMAFGNLDFWEDNKLRHARGDNYLNTTCTIIR